MSTYNPSQVPVEGTHNNQLGTLNLLQPTAFKLVISSQEFVHMEFFAQSVELPSLTVSSVEVPYRKVAGVPFAGDKLTYGELSANILVDEEMNSYVEMYNWLNQIVKENPIGLRDKGTGDLTTYADISVHILSSHNNGVREVKFRECVPTLLGGLSMDASAGDINSLTFPVSWRFAYFEL